MMELISSIPVFGGFLGVVIPFVFVLSIVVFVHEFGHYIVGRWCGIHALTFSIGFGPKLISRRDRHGTVWQVAALPLGGMVKFLGDADGSSRADKDALAHMDAATLKRSFHGAAVWKRMLTVAAGPVFNFILSIVVFAGLLLWQGVPMEPPTLGTIVTVEGQENPLRPGDRVVAVNGEAVTSIADISTIASEMDPPGPITVDVLRDGRALTLDAPYPMPPLVSGVFPFSAARSADLREGDLIQSIDGAPVASFRQLLAAVEGSGGETLSLGVLREGETVEILLAPQATDTETPEGGFEKRYRIGVALASLYVPATTTPGPFRALTFGATETLGVITSSFNAIKHLILGNLGTENLQGPIGIAQVSGETAKQGLYSVITLIAVLSTAVGMINLFPVPVLDGGHLVFFTYEAITGRPPSDRVLSWMMPAGLALVLSLMLFATYNDLIRLAAQLMS